MCLDTVDPEVKMTEGVGWKVVHNRGGWVVPILHGKQYRPGVWRRDPNHYRIDGQYDTGYHIHTTKDGCDIWMGETRQCKFREVVVTGTFKGHPVAVAKEIYILKRSEEKNES